MKARCVLAGGAVFVAWLAAQTPTADGKALFEKRCGGCHALDRDKEGPRLGGVYGRRAASVPSFEYSAALKKSKIRWTAETLDQWLADPEALVPGNDMTFHVENADARTTIIDWLKRNPKP
jgi:cytochrome c